MSIWLLARVRVGVHRDNAVTHSLADTRGRRREQVPGLQYTGLLSVNDHQHALRQLHQHVDAHLPRGIRRLCDGQSDCNSDWCSVDKSTDCRADCGTLYPGTDGTAFGCTNFSNNHTGTCYVVTNCSKSMRIVLSRQRILPRLIPTNELHLRVYQHHGRVMSIWVHAVRHPRTSARKNISTDSGRRRQVQRLR